MNYIKNEESEVKMSVKKFLIVILFFIFNIFSHGVIEYKVSGKVVHNGKGIPNVSVYITKIEEKHSSSTKHIYTNKDGNFKIYLKNGIYDIDIKRKPGYVIKTASESKTINVKGKNISNIIFFMYKECIVSGIVKLANGTSVKGEVCVIGSSYGGEIKSDGTYIVYGVEPGECLLDFNLFHFREQEQRIINLEEGEHRKGVNLIIPEAKLSLQGKIIVKDSGLPAPGRIINIFFKNEKGDYEKKTMFSDEKGNFKLNNIPPGTLWIIYFKKHQEDVYYQKEIVYDGKNPAYIELEYEVE
jgi:5-hydroxyisourate hydrolase-like protein (transthyretin family)